MSDPFFLSNKPLRAVIIGVGNMGSKYANLLLEKKIAGMELAALVRVNKDYLPFYQTCPDLGIPIYSRTEDFYADLTQEKIHADAAIITSPHYFHESLTVEAFSHGLHVLCEKPSGVYSRQARLMNEAADASGRNYSLIVNQRTHPIYKRLKELVSSGRYGKIKRVNWIVTDWYRPDYYYTSSSWHGNWTKDGGGVLLNQAPHNLDLLCWICGEPARVSGFCQEGAFHNITVEDNVTAYMEWDNGAVGTFITSTGDAPGLNRLEITLEEGMLVCERGQLRIGEIRSEMGMPEPEYRATATDLFRKFYGNWTVENPPAEPLQYQIVLQSFSNACHGTGEAVADGHEGIMSLHLSNAIYLSSWKRQMVEIPAYGSAEEKEFEAEFENYLNQKIRKEQI